MPTLDQLDADNFLLGIRPFSNMEAAGQVNN